MTTTMPARLLRLLALLQGRREWPGAELAERLGVTTRTVRRDVDRLRELGYPVDSTTGTAGGYRLAAGTELPPLLLDDDEAVAVARGLIVAAGTDEAAMRALAKLSQVLPARLRNAATAVAETTVSLHGNPRTHIDPGLLAALATACRDHELITFDYERRDGAAARRRVEPYRLVAVVGLWYLVAFDVERDDWRTFRVDRLTDPGPTKLRFRPRELPGGGVGAHIVAGALNASYRYSGVALVQAPAAEVLSRLHNPLPGKVEALDERTCRVRLGSHDFAQIVAEVAAFEADFTLPDAPELAANLREFGRRLTRQ
ncbi:WYL domain-containing protein [Actinomycetes bacterium KLBMP 9759]